MSITRISQYFNTRVLWYLVAFIVLWDASYLCFPLLRSDDPLLYANIAKHIAVTNDWINLFGTRNNEWLDKPHFMFWVSALSYKVFGVNSFAYLFPGYIFFLIGGLYTYRLAKILFNSDTGLLALLLYLTSLHLLISNYDLRAEAYLLGEIIPACFYLYCLNKSIKFSYSDLLCAALFSAMALMTKGIFVLITIFSGVISLDLYKIFTAERMHRWYSLRFRWILVFILTLISIMPELASLYLQFDLHPEKTVYTIHGVSGVRWFFWDSQFGRFFNRSMVHSSSSQSFTRYFFFIHTFMWSFLPWSVLFIVALVRLFKVFRKPTHLPKIQLEKEKYIFLLGSFFVTFILFSISSFQLDYYINILLPIAAIICADWLYKFKKEHVFAVKHWVFYFQIWLAIILTILVIALGIFIFGSHWLILIALLGVGVFTLFIIFTHYDDLYKALAYPILAISLVFTFAMMINGKEYATYEPGYQISQRLKHYPKENVVDFRIDSLSLDFYAPKNYYFTAGVEDLQALPRPYYLMIKQSDLALITPILSQTHMLFSVSGCNISTFAKNLLVKPRLDQNLIQYVVLEVK